MKKLVKSVPFWIVLLVVIVFAGLATKRIIDGKKHNEALTKPEQSQELMPVRAVKVHRGSIQEWVYGEGTVRSVCRKFLNFGQSGEVVRIGKDADGNEFREGSRVSGPQSDGQGGQLLAQLDQREALITLNIAQTALEEAQLNVTIAKAQAQQAENDYHFAKADFDRVVRLDSEGTSIVSYEEALAQAKENVTAIQATVLQAESDLKLAKARLELAQRLGNERTTLIASEEALAQAREQVTIAEATLTEAENNYTFAKTDFTNKEKLFKDGIISKHQYDEAKNIYLNAENTLKTSKANLQSARSRLKMAETDLKKVKIDVPVTELETARTEYQRAEANLNVQKANLQAAQSRVKTAEAELNQATINLPVTEYEAAKNKYLNVETLLKTQKTNLQAAHLKVEEAQARVKQAELALEQTVLRSPFDGIITHFNIRLGDYVVAHSMNTSSEDTMKQTAAVVVIDPNLYEITLSLPSFAGELITLGQSVYIRASTDAFPDEMEASVAENQHNSEIPESLGTFAVKNHITDGSVYSVSPSFSEEGRSVQVKIRTEKGKKYLKDGMFVSCRIVVQEKDNALLIPTKSVIYRDDERYVFIADPETGTVAKRQFISGLESPMMGNIEVLDGIEEGELVVIDQRVQLVDGANVKVIPLEGS